MSAVRLASTLQHGAAFRDTSPTCARPVGPRVAPHAPRYRHIQVSDVHRWRVRERGECAALPRHGSEYADDHDPLIDSLPPHASVHPDDMPGQTMDDVLTAATHLVQHCPPSSVLPAALPTQLTTLGGIAVQHHASAGNVCTHPGAPQDDATQLELAVKMYCASLLSKPLLQHVDDWECPGLLGLQPAIMALATTHVDDEDWFAANAVWNSDDE